MTAECFLVTGGKFLIRGAEDDISLIGSRYMRLPLIGETIVEDSEFLLVVSNVIHGTECQPILDVTRKPII